MEKKKPRRVPTEYQCIYRQTDKDLYDVRYNYKELNEDTGKTEYKTKCPVCGSVHHLSPRRLEGDVPSQEAVDQAAAARDRDLQAFNAANEAWSAQRAKVTALTQQILQDTEQLLEGVKGPVSETGRTAALAALNRRESDAAADREKAAQAAINERIEFEKGLAAAEEEELKLAEAYTVTGKLAAAKIQEADSQKQRCREMAEALFLTDVAALETEISLAQEKEQNLVQEISLLNRQAARKKELDTSLPEREKKDISLSFCSAGAATT